MPRFAIDLQQHDGEVSVFPRFLPLGWAAAAKRLAEPLSETVRTIRATCVELDSESHQAQVPALRLDLGLPESADSSPRRPMP